MSDPVHHVVCPSCSAVNRIAASQPMREAKCGKCHQKLFTGKPVAADGKTLERHIGRNDIPVVVDFWASWCGPCMAMAPAYERAAAGLEPCYRLLKVNADEEQHSWRDSASAASRHSCYSQTDALSASMPVP